MANKTLVRVCVKDWIKIFIPHTENTELLPWRVHSCAKQEDITNNLEYYQVLFYTPKAYTLYDKKKQTLFVSGFLNFGWGLGVWPNEFPGLWRFSLSERSELVVKRCPMCLNKISEFNALVCQLKIADFKTYTMLRTVNRHDRLNSFWSRQY